MAREVTITQRNKPFISVDGRSHTWYLKHTMFSRLMDVKGRSLIQPHPQNTSRIPPQVWWMAKGGNPTVYHLYINNILLYRHPLSTKMIDLQESPILQGVTPDIWAISHFLLQTTYTPWGVIHHKGRQFLYSSWCHTTILYMLLTLGWITYFK